jgi:hypothetical protein
VTWVHETTHGINADIRNSMNRTGKAANGFYVTDENAAVVVEPAFRKSQVGSYVPGSLRNLDATGRFNTYVVWMGTWDSTPLYIFDEWISYTNGADAAVSMVLDSSSWGDRDRGDAFNGMLEFTVYAISLAQAAEKLDPDYLSSNKQFKAFLAYNVRRAMEIYQRGRILSQFSNSSLKDYYEALLSSPDAESFRQFTYDFFGREWANAIIYFGKTSVNNDKEDEDSDGVVNSEDRCLGTKAGAIVWKEGEWKGCTEGQTRNN